MKINIPLKKFLQTQKSFKIFLPKIGLSLLVILVLLVLLELILRIYISPKPPIIFKMADSAIAYELNPNYQGIFSDVLVKINSQGFRQENEVQLIKELKTTRIVGLGDSVAFGFGLEEEKSYLRTLENLLNQSPAQKYEVISAAVTGYNIFQERKFLELKILKFKPDVLILSFVLNDIGGDFHVPNMIHRTLTPFKRGAYSLTDLNSFEKVFYLLFRKSYLYQWVHPKLSILWGFGNSSSLRLIGNYAEETIFFYRDGYYSDKRYSSAFEKTEDELLKINNLAEKNGIKLVVAIFPVEIQLKNSALRKPQERLSQFCQKNSLNCLDLLEILGKERDKELFNDGIGHPNEYASAIIAQAIFDYLVQNNIIASNAME